MMTLECGMYKVCCDSCPTYLVGKSGRSFKKQFSEHLPGLEALNNSKISDLGVKSASALAIHCFDNNRRLSIDSLKPIHIITQDLILDLLLEIKEGLCQGKMIGPIFRSH
jgi:hypothetical protein